MRVLVATTQTQGEQPGDFHRALDGELVLPFVGRPWCTACALDPDNSSCGCERSFVGLSSGELTTTAMVTDLEHWTLDDYAQVLDDFVVREHWATSQRRDGELVGPELTASDRRGTVDRDAAGLLFLAAIRRPGTVMVRLGLDGLSDRTGGYDPAAVADAMAFLYDEQGFGGQSS